jgi:hypothetical protein
MIGLVQHGEAPFGPHVGASLAQLGARGSLPGASSPATGANAIRPHPALITQHRMTRFATCSS